MAKLIQDVVSPTTVKKLPSNDVLMAALFIRGVTIEEIFGRYYEYEANGDARTDEHFGNDEEGQHGGAIKPRKPMTVGDAVLAGRIDPLPSQPVTRQPF